ncbi:MAG TPA: hypothetical protein VEU96_13980 [Bryobacteraceae bacterium]|nr:hypothetical protein [Bryobacteraceae bacterium]
MRFRHVLRRLSRAPMFTAVTLLTLALGIGANSAIFSVINGIVLKPLPYPHPEPLHQFPLSPGLTLEEFEDVRFARSCNFWGKGLSAISRKRFGC